MAVQGTSLSPGVDNVFDDDDDDGAATLDAAGFGSRSAFLVSPTFGGISWLAHSTFQSGLRIDNQQRYDDLMKTDRFTVSDAFKKAGWRTSATSPPTTPIGQRGRTSTTTRSTTSATSGTRAPSAVMPDQYILAQFQRDELAQPHQPVMAELDLVSSHTPRAPLPRMVDWDSVGDGPVYKPMPAQGQKATTIWRDPNQVRAAYGQSIQYALTALISFVQHFADPNLVLVMFGDHQPATIVSGQGATHDTPISIVAHDPSVLDAISGWGWQDGLHPSPSAPVWPMESFRDKFLTAFDAPVPGH